MASINYYYTSVTGNLETKKQQQKIEMILEAKKIPFEKVDVAADEDAKKKMRKLTGDPTVLPPQLFNGEQYCGNYEAFDEAVENGELNKFLKL